MLVLGIETSCDETGVGLYGGESPRLHGHLLHSQADLHARYGGVVPELAARDHQERLLPLLQELQVDLGGLSAIACTAGPGLLGALKTGLSLAAGLALGAGIPLLPVHHMEAHLLSPLLQRPVDFPWLSLLVSGGHTMLVQVEGLGRYRLLGQTRDDAVGEAFDKVAKLLGESYPGGPALERKARSGNPQRFDFPRPMTGQARAGAEFDFSFSGLKTAVLYCLRDQIKGWQPGLPVPTVLAADVAASFQRAVAETLAHKARAAVRHTGAKRLMVAGGVCANGEVRRLLAQAAAASGAELIAPEAQFCTDNGAMIALTGWLRLQAGEEGTRRPGVRSRWSLEELQPPPLATAQFGAGS